MSSDYLELGTPVEDETFDLAVYANDGHLLGVFRRITGDPVRYKGTWTIAHVGVFGASDAIIEAARVAYFVVFNTREHPDG